MNENDSDIDALVGEWMTLKDAAKELNVSPNRVKQFIADHKLLGVRRGGELCVPAAFISRGDVVKGLPGTLTVLADSGFSTEEALQWMFTPDDTLPGAPIEALSENRGTEVRRRAQAMAF
ncbi:Rv2175c family DNA-binding protein [Streptomonospora wellingtoniae]|uniref:Rv2175c family DNA-binding protein n=1 Tax=Streptomonospora wellingtoniae TaxID=3075544 RepID=A0ABU2KP99_9ACTN|nr:Rv2175c family DNA-binding protein [Streptomonospora sp. DSM 45055]MDT0301083.1 Rv2175c family DNA-binding protein [Streptomonospora sp. DSM 45055]